MKKMWKFRKDSRAVSPVIATILMVAITVVLAAVLYVMVMGFGGDGSAAPTTAFNPPQKIASNMYKISISSIDKSTQWEDCKLQIVNGTAGTAADLGAETSGNISNVAWTLVDLAGDGKIGAGDYFTVVTQSDTQYQVILLWGSENDQIASVTFTAS